MPDFTVKIEDAELTRLIAESPEMGDKFVRALAFQVQGRAQELAPVLYGVLKNSIFTKTSKSDGYSAAVAAANGAAVASGREAPIIPDPTPAAKKGVAYVAPSVEYAYWQEFGTSKMAAQPYMSPAVEMVTQNEAEQIAKDVIK
jgi:HK97 gp10 family phage protein